LHGYSFTHEEPRQGPNYYRLKSVDLDGSIDYSNIIAVNLEETKIGQDFEVIISPNPADQQITISEGTLLGITDVHGKQYAASLNVSNLPSGIYFAQISLDNKNVVVERFLKH